MKAFDGRYPCYLKVRKTQSSSSLVYKLQTYIEIKLFSINLVICLFGSGEYSRTTSRSHLIPNAVAKLLIFELLISIPNLASILSSMSLWYSCTLRFWVFPFIKVKVDLDITELTLSLYQTSFCSLKFSFCECVITSNMNCTVANDADPNSSLNLCTTISSLKPIFYMSIQCIMQTSALIIMLSLLGMYPTLLMADYQMALATFLLRQT
ncbi:hypothetical protein FGO68_gene7707 [Halteria grandinella]|uniref:Uncharacterized protein n=1 Tax=Halteria grandinella TaxID=5974 RepID=A0A8J8T7D5_HALGN|nr:hypothetical protein FGO68_gene7707 [Halteria grandinella]